MTDVQTFTKKPVSIEAVEWTGKNIDEIWEAFGAASIYGPTPEKNPDQLIVSTSEGDMRANVGDWIIKGVHGELYPCKPDIFRATYSPDAGDWCNVCRKVVNLNEEDAWIDEDEGGWLHQACAELADDVEASR